MRFLGHKHTETTKRKIGLANKGRATRGRGWKHSGETKKKISEARKGIKFSREHLKNLSISHKKKRLPEKVKKKLSEKLKEFWHLNPNKKEQLRERMKRNQYAWKNGNTPINKKIRHSIEFRLWREAVFARDNWTCQKCKERGGRLHPHHIKSFAQYPELRFAIDNGITFCEKCHKKYHKKYGYCH